MRRHWGYMPQEQGSTQGCRPVTRWCTSADYGMSRREAQRKARALLDEFGIAERWDERTDALSGGRQLAAAAGRTCSRP